MNIDATDFVKQIHSSEQILMTHFKTASSIEASTEIDTPFIEKVYSLLSGTIKAGRNESILIYYDHKSKMCFFHKISD